MKKIKQSFRATILLLILAFTAVLLSVSSVFGMNETGSHVNNAQSDNGEAPALVGDNGDSAIISTNRATGMARFLRFADGGSITMVPGESVTAQADAFFAQHGSLFGISNPAEQLVLLSQETDQYGDTHLTYRQQHNGVEVFAGIILVHLNNSNAIKVVNGVFVPDLAVNTTPTLSVDDAGALAESAVNGYSSSLVDAHTLATAPAIAANARLYVYRDGLIQGVAGNNHLVYEFEVMNGIDIHQLIYVDAHKGAVINQIDKLEGALNRIVYSTTIAPANLIWQEGDAYPWVGNAVTETAGVNNLIDYTEDTYDLFNNTFGYDAWDAAGSDMIATWNNPAINCPNANWNGISINFCVGTTSDDVVAHEWGHAYTDSTHNLIYQWQPGALNESYSDIWGELVDQFNGAGTDAPNTIRAAGQCSQYGGFEPSTMMVNAPGGIAGDMPVGGANFNPAGATATGDVVLVDDGTDTTSDGCEAIVNGGAVSGNIALIDRGGGCSFVQKATNAIAVGATGVIIANNVSPGTITMGGAGPLTVPSVMVSLENGQLIKDNLPNVNVTINTGAAGTEDSYRWLMGEDAFAFNGAIRDMWNPTCFGDPGKVTDESQYVCATSDGGGVHTNSGVPNHTFALLVDGGTYNGQTISAIGWVKAAHIYWQAQTTYQNPATDFPDHADALEQSCADLTGVNLTGFDGNPSGEMIDAADCTAVTNAVAATELRTDPTFCGFTPMLDQNAPQVCADGSASFWSEDFATDPGTWTLTNTGVYTEYTPRDWQFVSTMPFSRTGGFFGIDSFNIGDCTPGSDDQSGVMYLDSPAITVPAGADGDSIVLTFDHYVATEAGWDGGNVWINVNGGGWALMPATDYRFNPYNGTLGASDNPLGGQEAFTGSDGGLVTGSWGQSQVDAGDYVSPGDSVQFRFALGVDGCNGLDGWYLDQVEVYHCAEPIIAVDPTSMTSVHLNDQPAVMTQTLTISNVGSLNLDWSFLMNTMTPVMFSHSMTMTVDNALSCPIGPNSWLREFDVANDFNLPGASIDITSADFGIFDSIPVTTSQFVDVNLYTLSGAFTNANMTSIGSSSYEIVGTITQTVVNAPVAGSAPADSVIVAEVHSPTGINTTPPHFRLGMNSGGQTASTYIVGPACGLTEPTATEVINFPDSHAVLKLNGNAYYEGCTGVNDVPWLNVSPITGSVPAPMSDMVDVTFDSTGMAPGVYTTTVCIFSNDPANPIVQVPMTMIVRDVPTDVALTSFGDSQQPMALFAVLSMVVLTVGILLINRRRQIEA